MDIRHPAVFEPREGGGLPFRFVDPHGVFAGGDTEEERLFNAATILDKGLALTFEQFASPRVWVRLSRPIRRVERP